MAGWIDIPQFVRAAGLRLDSAELLRKNGMNADSIYLAGYAVECALKALLLSTYPFPKRRGVTFQGAGWHNYARLREELHRRRIDLPSNIMREFRRVHTWSNELRYETSRRTAEEAETFCKSAMAILVWVKGRLP